MSLRKTNEFYIGNRLVSENTDPLVIVEIGINHGGSLEVAKKMVDLAFESGAEIIKHQTHILEDEMSPSAKKIIPGNADISIYEIMKSCMLNEDEELELKDYVNSKGMIFISTPFSRAAANRLEKFNVPAYKIGSGECNNYPLIKHIASFKKPIILSTGMNDLESIEKAVNIIRKEGIPFAILHCTNVYPTNPELVRLGALTELKKKFPDAVIGLSDHTITNYACLGAVALGACILERHFTDSMDREGPDIICSMDPKALKDLIEGSLVISKCRGGKKGPVKEEESCIKFAFSTVVAIKDVNEGEKFTKDNIWVKRPGIGEIKAEYYEDILEKKANKKLLSGEHISYSDIII
ncbi:MAG: N-acetylneuraminate synthase family protein [Candidatus Gracilibacteria bacterium]|nr:N-acetylneuraminate synthase family protein [Candidatus Gracilibacteria bacterium]